MVHQRLTLAVALLLPFFTTPAVFGGLVQKSGLQLPPSADTDRKAVKQMFKDSYAAYTKYALNHDSLAPVSKSSLDGRNGWGATIVDSMSTMHIMGLEDHFNQAVEFASSIDFTKSNTPDTVSVFETTIRYMGGLLSAYELSGKTHAALLDKAKEVADKMSHAWTSANAVPFTHVDFGNNIPAVGFSNIAEAGTLSLEWYTLSKCTGDPKYKDLAEGSVRQIASNPAPLPGLPAQGIDPATGLPVGAYVTWGGGSDSYFEYLIKYARLTNTDDPVFVQKWFTAVESSIKFLLKVSTVGEHTYLADFGDDRRIRHISSHLACFHGGNWIYGGKLLDKQEYVDIGLQLTDACWNTYASTETGIGPEVFAFKSADGDYTGGDTPSKEDEDFYAEHGFYITAGDYFLRPEVLESNFYAWRATGDEKYLKRAQAAIARFQKYLGGYNTGLYAGLYDVRDANSQKIDDMESFWFAETLKYLYLTFDDPEHISLDKYVFNTEAHPFLAPEAKETYGANLSPAPEPVPIGSPSGTQGGALPEISPNPSLPKSIKDMLHLDGVGAAVAGLPGLDRLSRMRRHRKRVAAFGGDGSGVGPPW